MRNREWLLGLVLLGVGWPGLVVGGEPDPEEVRRRMEKYEWEAAEEAAKSAPKPRPKSAPVVDHDREAWQSAEKCGKAACFRAYLEDYPKGRYVRMARARLESEPDSKPAVVTERPAPAARPTDRRFTDNGNGAVTDNHSGLIWLKNANCFGRQDWSTAMNLTRRLSSGDCGLRDGSGAGQWRLPSQEEWETLIDKDARDPSLPRGHPFTGVQSNNYWSSTTNASYSYTDAAWDVNLNFGVVGANVKSNSAYVWPVRGGR